MGLSPEQEKRKQIATIAASRCMKILTDSSEIREIIMSIEDSGDKPMVTQIRVAIETVLNEYKVRS